MSQVCWADWYDIFVPDWKIIETLVKGSNCTSKELPFEANVQMRWKERFVRGSPPLDLNLSWRGLRKISFPAICQLMLGFRTDHSVHCNALCSPRKSHAKVRAGRSLEKARTMTDAIWMTETNRWKWPTFGLLWPAAEKGGCLRSGLSWPYLTTGLGSLHWQNL